MNDIQKEFVPYEEALELEQLGFDESCFTHSKHKKKCEYHEQPGGCPLPNIHCNYPDCTVDESIESIPLPTYSQVFRFFRDKHSLYVHSVPEFYLDGINFNWQILWRIPKERWDKDKDGRVRTFTTGTLWYGDNGEYPTQEDADLAILRKLIQLVKQKLQ
jgi:hypothetical protein